MARDGTVTLVGGKIYPSPSAAPIQNGVLLVRNGIITALGIRETVTIPPNTEILDCTNRVVTAAFWNSHVHFTESKWYPADKLTTAQLAANLRDMLTGYAFVRVLDTGSDLKNTLMIRSRIETGELRGPFIATTGPGFVPANGSPFYSLPLRLPELLTSADAAKLVKGRIQEGADAVKLFTSSWASERKIEVMLPEIVRSTVRHTPVESLWWPMPLTSLEQ